MKTKTGQIVLTISVLGAIASAYVLLSSMWLSATPAWEAHEVMITRRYWASGVALGMSFGGMGLSFWLIRKSTTTRESGRPESVA